MNKLTKSTKNKELIISELRYRRLFETAQDGILLIDFETGMILDANQFLIDLLGYSKADFLKKYLWEVGVFKDVAASKDNFKTLQNKRYVRFEDLPLETTGGKKIDVEFVANAYQVDNSTIIQCDIRDITDRKKAEKKAMEAREFSDAIIATVKDPILVLDREMKVYSANKRYYSFFKTSAEKTIGQDIYKIGNGQWNIKDLKKIIGSILPQKKQIRGCEIAQNFDNIGVKTLLLDVKEISIESGESRGIMLMIEDISDRTNSEGLLSSFETRYRKLFESAIDGSLILDADTGTVIDVNQLLIDLLGLPIKQLLSKKIWELGFLKDVVANKKQFLELKKGGFVQYKDLPLEAAKGKKIFVEFYSKIFTVDNQKIVQCIVRDVTEKRQKEIKTRESEILFRQLFENMSSGVVVYEAKNNGEDFIIKKFNSAAERIEDAKREEIVGKSVKLVFPGIKDFGLLKVLQRVWKTGKPENFPVSFYQDNRVAGWKENYVYRLSNNDIVVVYDDVTEKKRAEDLLQRNETNLRATLNSTGDGVLAINDRGKIIFANERFAEFWRIPEKLLKKKDDKILLKFVLNQLSDTKGFLTKVEALYKSDKNSLDDIKFKDGRTFERYSTPLILKKKIIGRVWSFRDITQRLKAEQEVIEARAESEAILSSIGDSVFATDKDGIILMMNKIAEDMIGLTAKDVIGKHYDQVITFIKENDEKPCNNFIAEAINNNKITKMANHVMLVRADGTKIPVADSAAPIKNIDGDIVGCVVVFHDVTHERQIDTAKTEFVSLAAHQLRTPLSTINWYSEMLLSEEVGTLANKQKQYSEEIYSASKRMVRLVDALLNVSRLELGTFEIKPKTIDLLELAKVSISDFDLQIRNKSLVLKEKFDKRISKFNADPKLLSIVFQNLLSNSIKYSKPGGKIALSVSKEKDVILVTVSDNGIGIPKAQQGEIFKKLFRADNAKGADPDGNGLGLYIVKEILDHSGGKTWFKSQEGVGSTFFVSLPLSGMAKKSGSRQLMKEKK